MAIIPSLPGLKVQVCVAQNTLHEHLTTTTQPPATFLATVVPLPWKPCFASTCYIEARDQQEFYVTYTLDEDFPFQTRDLAIRVEVRVNGDFVDSRINNWKYKHTPIFDNIYGKRVRTKDPAVMTILGTGWIQQRMRFARLGIGELSH